MLTFGANLDRIEASIVNDAGGFFTYVCDNEAKYAGGQAYDNDTDDTQQRPTTATVVCDVTITRNMLTQPVLFRSSDRRRRPERIKCLDCDIGILRERSGLRLSMAAETADLTGSHVEHVEAGAIAGTIHALLLSYNTLTTLDDAKLFAQTAQLRTLHLDHNELFYVDDRALDGLPELTELWLNHNRIVSAVARMFVHLPQLEKLRLHGNRLRTLDGNLLAAHKRLRELTLYDNELVHVHDDVWQIIQRIGSFDIANVQMQLDRNARKAATAAVASDTGDEQTVTSDEAARGCRIGSMNRHIPGPQLYNASCGNLSAVPSANVLLEKRIKYLNLRHNLIGELGDNAFANAHEISPLLTIDLTHNQIESLDPNAFDACTGLKELLLAHNFIRYLSEGQFARLTNLLQLQLHHNHIHTINAQQFWHTVRLQRLTLQLNRIKSVGEKAFDQLQRLDRFDMSDNRVQNEELIFLNSHRVRLSRSNVAYVFIGDRVVRLEAAHNRLHSLNLRHAHSLLHLNVSDNHIDTISLEAVTGLQSIDMSGNQLTHISFEHNAQLVSVTLADNFLTDVRFASATSGASSVAAAVALLHTLDLSGNQLQALDLSAANMYNLQRLNVSKNQLTSLDQFRLLYALRELDVSANPIGHLSLSTFQNMDSLQTLRMHAIELTQLDAGIFRPLVALRRLDLSANLLSAETLNVLASFSGLVSLRQLSLSDNTNLTTEYQMPLLDTGSLLLAMPRLQQIGVSGMRWPCDRLGEFVRAMEAAYVEVDSEWEQVIGASVHGIRCLVNDDEENIDDKHVSIDNNQLAIDVGGGNASSSAAEIVRNAKTRRKSSMVILLTICVGFYLAF